MQLFGHNKEEWGAISCSRHAAFEIPVGPPSMINMSRTEIPNVFVSRSHTHLRSADDPKELLFI